MNNGLTKAPWLVFEPDPTNVEYVLIQNNLNRKRWRLKKQTVKNLVSNELDSETRAFLLAEALVISPKKVLITLEDEYMSNFYGFVNNEQIGTMIPTHACHFGCPYCYNKNIRSPKNEFKLKPETISEKLIQYYRRSPAQKWALHVIGGGEPLLAADYVSTVSDAVRFASIRDGRDFELDIVTNGHLLYGKTLSRLIGAGLKKVRVTLDPDHDKSRPLADGKPTFNKIFSNLKALPQEVELQLNSNVPFGKLAEFRKLLEKLEPIRKRVADFNVSLILKPLEEKAPSKRNQISRMYGSDEMDLLINLVGLIDNAGFKRKDRFPRIECEAGRSCEKLVINMRGETTCCAGLDGLEEYRTDLIDGVVQGEMNDKVLNDESWRKQCFTDGAPCAYLPLCHTGCRLISVSQGLGWWKRNCELLYLDRLTRYELRRWAGHQ